MHIKHHFMISVLYIKGFLTLADAMKGQGLRALADMEIDMGRQSLMILCSLGGLSLGLTSKIGLAIGMALEYIY